VVNNLQDPVQLFENQLCLGQNMLVDVRWPGSQNSYALGTTVLLHTSTGVYQRIIQAASGYLSGVPARVHFGFPASSDLESLVIIWPDGERSILTDLQKGYRVRVERQ
jgi:hypothetical protein